MKEKIVVLDGYALNPGDLSWAEIESLGELTVYDRSTPEETAGRIGEAKYIFTNKTRITREIMEACPGLRFIGMLATGYDVVDVAAAGERGIAVCNVPSYSTDSVAQFAFALLLEICHHVGAHDRAVQEGRWSSGPDYTFWDYPLIELAGKTMGIIGFGRIGQRTAEIARAFGMKVIAYNRSESEGGRKLAEYVSLDRLLAEADVISLHVPAFAETKNIIRAESIARMKDGVIVLNTSRGALVNEADMRAALESGKVAWYAADVVSAEPIRTDNPLLGAKNCFLTPHIAWAPDAARARLMSAAAENLRSFMAGKVINQVG